MRVYNGRIEETRLRVDGTVAAWIGCTASAIPQPGRYCMAWATDDLGAPLAIPVFAGERSADGFLTASPIPAIWSPGQQISLRGPLGHGFSLPAMARRLGLAVFGDSADRLLPLANKALALGAAIAIFSDCAMPALNAEVEIHPLNALVGLLDWPDYLALDLPAHRMGELTNLLRDSSRASFNGINGEALIMTEMPCGGSADCGACSLDTLHDVRLVCQDGPVFNLSDLARR